MKKKWILRHCDLDLWPKVTKFNRVRASAGSNHLVKTAFKLVHPFGWNFVHKRCRTHTHTHRHTDKLQWKYNPSTISWRCNKHERFQTHTHLQIHTQRHKNTQSHTYTTTTTTTQNSHTWEIRYLWYLFWWKKKSNMRNLKSISAWTDIFIMTIAQNHFQKYLM